MKLLVTQPFEDLKEGVIRKKDDVFEVKDPRGKQILEGLPKHVELIEVPKVKPE